MNLSLTGQTLPQVTSKPKFHNFITHSYAHCLLVNFAKLPTSNILRKVSKHLGHFMLNAKACYTKKAPFPQDTLVQNLKHNCYYLSSSMCATGYPENQLL